MRTILSWVLGLALVSLAAAAATGATTDGAAQLEFTTATTKGKYAPKHVLAVWVTDAQTNFIKTVVRQAGKRQDKLLAWNKARQGNRAVDGVSGATLAAHGPRSARWNCRDAANELVPDGTYLFFVEFTETKGQGPLAVIPFTKGPKAQNQTVEELKNLSNIKVIFTPGK
jgi:hypothetical protein